jgi:hypothetical protein
VLNYTKKHTKLQYFFCGVIYNNLLIFKIIPKLKISFDLNALNKDGNTLPQTKALFGIMIFEVIFTTS